MGQPNTRIVAAAVSKRLNPSMGLTRCFIRRRSYSITLFRYLQDRTCTRRGKIPEVLSLTTVRCEAAVIAGYRAFQQFAPEPSLQDLLKPASFIYAASRGEKAEKWQNLRRVAKVGLVCWSAAAAKVRLMHRFILSLFAATS